MIRTEKILRLMSFFLRVSFELISRDVFKVGQCERNDMFSEQTKKGRKKNVEQFTSSKTPSTRARRFVHKTRARADLYIKYGHTQGLGNFRTNPYYVFSRGRGVKVWEFRVY